MKKSLFLALSVVGTLAASSADLSAGFSRVDITPPLGTAMTGYFKERRAKKVLDPLQINCVAFSDGKAKALVMVVDTILRC